MMMHARFAAAQTLTTPSNPAELNTGARSTGEAAYPENLAELKTADSESFIVG